VIDPRDATDIPATGIIPEAMNISYGALTYKADNELPPEWREPELEDRSRPIITACESGELGCLAGKLLKDMGFSNVSILEGGTSDPVRRREGKSTTMAGPSCARLVAEEIFHLQNHLLISIDFSAPLNNPYTELLCLKP
jgi:rhodanese-related sulfurtransferase